MQAGRVVIVDPRPALRERLAAACLHPALTVRIASPAECEPADVLLVGGEVAAGLALLASHRARDADAVLMYAGEDHTQALEALASGGCDRVLLAWQRTSQVTRQLLDACEEALERRSRRAVIDELAGSHRELQEALEQRSASLEQARQQLRQQHQELVVLETQAVVSHIARGLAHELNNPLAAILGYAQRLRRTRATDEEVVRRLDVILAEVDRCRSLVEQLRGLATPLAEAAVACAPEQLLAEAILRRRDSGLAVPPLIVGAAVPQVLAAPQSLVHVFEQLLDNAVLAGAHGLHFSGFREGARVRLILSNDGATPDEAAVRNATRPFFTTWGAAGHRGLGLAMASAVLRDQAGTLELTRRTDGPGASSVLTLPAVAEAEAAPAPVSTAAAGTVLVVDDEPLVAELLRDALEECGRGCTVVGSVEEARAALQAQPVRALICDIRLPDGSGIALVAEALARHPSLAGHVALVTGGGAAVVETARSPETPWPVLTKPFRHEEIVALVRRIA